MRILIIEDDRDTGLMIEEMLDQVPSARGGQVSHAASFTEAIRTLTAEAVPDLIVCDCNLGDGGSGVDLWRACQSRMPKVPFLMISGMPDFVFNELLSADLPCPPRFLAKPFSHRQFRDQVDGALVGATGERPIPTPS